MPFGLYEAGDDTVASGYSDDAGIGGLGSTMTKRKSKGNRSYSAHVIRLPSSCCRQKVCAGVVMPQSS